jgi:hypothetical protein
LRGFTGLGGAGTRALPAGTQELPILFNEFDFFGEEAAADFAV